MRLMPQNVLRLIPHFTNEKYLNTRQRNFKLCIAEKNSHLQVGIHHQLIVQQPTTSYNKGNMKTKTAAKLPPYLRNFTLLYKETSSTWSLANWTLFSMRLQLSLTSIMLPYSRSPLEPRARNSNSFIMPKMGSSPPHQRMSDDVSPLFPRETTPQWRGTRCARSMNHITRRNNLKIHHECSRLQ